MCFYGEYEEDASLSNSKKTFAVTGTKDFPVRRERRSRHAAFLGKRSQISAGIQITEQIAMTRIPRIASVRMGGFMEHETPGIRGENLRFHVDVAGGKLRIDRQLIERKRIRNFFPCKVPETFHSAFFPVIRTVRKLLGL